MSMLRKLPYRQILKQIEDFHMCCGNLGILSGRVFRHVLLKAVSQRKAL